MQLTSIFQDPNKLYSSSWLVEQKLRSSIPGLADTISSASKSRYGWNIAEAQKSSKPTNQPTQ